MLIYNKVNGKLWCCEVVMAFTSTMRRRFETNNEKCHASHNAMISKLKDNDGKVAVFGMRNKNAFIGNSSEWAKSVKNQDITHYDIRGVKMSRENVIKYAM